MCNLGKRLVVKRRKKAAKGAVYDARRGAEQRRFGDVLRRNDNRIEVFEKEKRLCATNP